jgi:ComF family protein
LNRLHTIYHRLLPQPCALCQLPITQSKIIALCDECHYSLPWLGHSCSICALPLTDHKSHFCGQCIQKPPVFYAAKIPFRYDYPIDQMILDFKFQQGFARGKSLSHLLVDFLRDAYKDAYLPDAIIPVPMYWQRRFLRGFNQSEMLARDIAKTFSIPTLTQVCVRHHHQQAQKDSNQQSRLSNLKDAFSINLKKRFLIEGKHLALLDDVVTTGATARELGKLLMSNGPASVVVWALARTPGLESR